LTIGSLRSGVAVAQPRCFLCPERAAAATDLDEQTGYRYYAMSQLSEALLVSRLRAAEMPVAMRGVLACTAPAQKEILDVIRTRSRNEHAPSTTWSSNFVMTLTREPGR